MFFKGNRDIDTSKFATREELVTTMDLQVKVNESTGTVLHTHQEYLDAVHKIINVQREQIDLLEKIIKEQMKQQSELNTKVEEIERALCAKEVKNG